MAILVRSADLITPSTFAVDLNTIPAAVANGKGPYLAALELWLDVADAAAGGWTLDLEYDDPTGLTTILAQGAFNTSISLAAAPAYRSVPLCPLSRLSATSNYRLSANLAGPAGTALVSYRVWLLPQFPTDLVGF